MSLTNFAALKLNMCTWILGFIVTFPYVYHVGLLPDENCSIKFCDEQWAKNSHRFWFSIITLILQFFLPFIAVSYFYGSVFWKLSKQREKHQHQPPPPVSSCSKLLLAKQQQQQVTNTADDLNQRSPKNNITLPTGSGLTNRLVDVIGSADILFDEQQHQQRFTGGPDGARRRNTLQASNHHSSSSSMVSGLEPEVASAPVGPSAAAAAAAAAAAGQMAAYGDALGSVAASSVSVMASVLAPAGCGPLAAADNAAIGPSTGHLNDSEAGHSSTGSSGGGGGGASAEAWLHCTDRLKMVS